jgi:hypothetical protein
MANFVITEDLIERVERRTAYMLAGLEVPELDVIRKNNPDGSTYVAYEPPPLPSGQELLAQMLITEGRPVDGPFVQVAMRAAICELLMQQQEESVEEEQQE